MVNTIRGNKEEHRKRVWFLLLCKGTRSFISDKTSGRFRELLKTDEMNLRLVSERRVERKGMYKFEQMGK